VGQVTEKLNSPLTTRTELVTEIAAARPFVEFAARNSYLPIDSRNAALALLGVSDEIVGLAGALELPPLAPMERATFAGALLQLYTMLARDLAWFDLYWIRPKLGYSTTALLTDASVIFPESIRTALSERIKYEIQQAANCLLYEASSAVGFHVLRAVEMVILDYFTIPGCDRAGVNNWADYAKRLRYYKVHRKIVGMVDRLASLHRNELMHAEAVLSVEEAAILFALMQEVLPIMIADVAKRKGAPIADFPILNDPRWQA